MIQVRRPVKMSAERLVELIGQNDSDLAEAHRQNLASWVETLRKRKAWLRELAARMPQMPEA